MLTSLASMAPLSSSTQAPLPPPLPSPLQPRPELHQLLFNLLSTLPSLKPSLLSARTSNKKSTNSATPGAVPSPRRRKRQRVARKTRSWLPRWPSRRQPFRPLGESRRPRGAPRWNQEGTASCRRFRAGSRCGQPMLQSKRSFTKVEDRRQGHQGTRCRGRRPEAR